MTTLRSSFYLGLISMGPWAIAMLVTRGVPAPAASALLFSTLLVAFVVWEAVAPHRKNWRVPDGQLANDVGHTVLGSALGSRIGAALAPMVVGAFAGSRGSLTTGHLVVDGCVVFMLIDAVRYFEHRLTHRLAVLWRFHRLHHDAGRIIAFKAGRSHVVDRILQMMCPLAVLAVGFDSDVVFLATATNGLMGLGAHANINVGGTFLDFVVVTPSVHRQHHGVSEASQRRNYGAALTVWDQMFGTFCRASPLAVGVDPPPPPGFLAQIAEPFVAPRSVTVVDSKSESLR